MTNACTIETARLTLRLLTVNDADALSPIFGDAPTMRYWHTPPHRTIIDTLDMLTAMLQPPSACWWAICLRGNDPAIGVVGYHGSPIPGMGYILRADYWRQGYATEAVRAALHHGFTRLELDRVELWIHQANLPSQRLAQKVGFTYKGRFWTHYPADHGARETCVYGLRASEWAPSRSATYPARSVPVCYWIQPVLPVHDVAATTAYYRDQLGFAVDFLFGDPPSHAAVSRGEWTPEAVRLQFTQVDATTTITPSGWIYIFVGPAIDQLHDAYRARGINITRELTSQPWGMREFAVADCNGYTLLFGAVF